MPAPRPWIGLNQLHLIGKLLDVMDEHQLHVEGFTRSELAAAEHLFDDLDDYLDNAIGPDWDVKEVL